ncbi:glycosyltransferase [Methylopila henanensis]|uniref:Glycosyltransferase n=1 Tax=Methylopila henanensis TaxID=873516 RepID=A0ABW4KAJ6_9HYPH
MTAHDAQSKTQAEHDAAGPDADATSTPQDSPAPARSGGLVKLVSRRMGMGSVVSAILKPTAAERRAAAPKPEADEKSRSYDGEPTVSASSQQDVPSGEAGEGLSEEIKRPGKAARQRDKAIAERDKARAERDEAKVERARMRKQRDELRERLKELELRMLDVEARQTAEAARPVLENFDAKRVASGVDALQTALDRLGRELGLPAREKTAKPVALAPAELAAKLFSYANFHRLEHLRRQRAPEVRARLEQGEKLSTTEQELLVQRHTPLMHKRLPERRTPPAEVAFLTVANDRFAPGLTGLLLSLLDVYPDFASDVLVYHDGTLTGFLQRQLLDVYPRIRFFTPDMDWLELTARESDNHKRIGKLGYMNLFAFTHGEYERVVVFDSDLLVIDDISALWEGGGDDFRACLDCGDREYVAMSPYTGAYIVNSGVISIPKSQLTAEAFEEARETAKASLLPLNDLIDRFADQKTWNMLLRDKPLTLLETNYNCNVKYVIRHLGGNLEGVSIVHFAGAKPWNTQLYLNDELVQEYNVKALPYPKIWTDQYRRLLYRSRLKSFRRDTANDRRTPVLAPIAGEEPTCVMIGNGPSIAETPLERLHGLEKFCFNWFILHERFEQVAPEHLVLASHMFFGGWNTQKPAFPSGYLARLRELKHRPALWTSYYFKPLFDELGLSQEFEVNYLLFEKPFKRFIDSLGATPCDIDGFLDDGRTGVLSFGAPIAAALGFRRMALVGCDSNYNAGGAGHGSNYFYDATLHTSPSTRADSLTATWAPGGAGHFAYDVVSEALARRGVEMVDATVGGGLEIGKIAMDDLVRAAERARRARMAVPFEAVS